MPLAQVTSDRFPHDLSHLLFQCGNIGCLKTIDTIPVIAGDSIELDLVGSLRLSPLRRGLIVDSKVDLFTFYIPHRHIYGDEWIQFMRDGHSASPLSTVERPQNRCDFLGISTPTQPGYPLPKWLTNGYENIVNNYFKPPKLADVGVRDSNEIPGTVGYRCQHLKRIWSVPMGLGEQNRPEESVSTSGDTLDIQSVATAASLLHTEQERDYFMDRYRDVVQDGFGGFTPYDGDNRPHLLMHTEFWASGYDIDGTDQASLGQFSGRVQQPFRHKVPRYFVPEHGAIWTLALVRFPPTNYYENHYLVQNPASTYLDIAGDPALVANYGPTRVNYSDFFTHDAGNSFADIAHSAWYREHPDRVDKQYELVGDYPFIVSTGPDWQKGAQIRVDQYDHVFQSQQLYQWNMQARSNVRALRRLPTARDAGMTNS